MTQSLDMMTQFLDKMTHIYNICSDVIPCRGSNGLTSEAPAHTNIKVSHGQAATWHTKWSIDWPDTRIEQVSNGQSCNWLVVLCRQSLQYLQTLRKISWNQWLHWAQYKYFKGDIGLITYHTSQRGFLTDHWHISHKCIYTTHLTTSLVWMSSMCPIYPLAELCLY